MNIKIKGRSYQMMVRRVNGKLRLFFKTDSECYNVTGFDFPHCGCNNLQHRLECWKRFKNFLIKGHYSGIVLFPEPEPKFC